MAAGRSGFGVGVIRGAALHGLRRCGRWERRRGGWTTTRWAWPSNAWSRGGQRAALRHTLERSSTKCNDRMWSRDPLSLLRFEFLLTLGFQAYLLFR